MSTEGFDHGHDAHDFSGEISDGRVHGLLATAFDGDVPALNLVPDVVEGYRRHRRRTRMLGSAGGALALAGLAVAGTVLGVGGGSGGRTQSAATAPGTVSVPSDIAAKCSGTPIRLLGGYGSEVGLYSADQPGLIAVCEQDLTTLRQLTGDTSLVPEGLSYPQSAGSTEPTALMTPQIGGPGATLQPGDYLGSLQGKPYHLSVTVFDKLEDFDSADNCTAKACPPNLTLADGHPATKLRGFMRDSYVVIHYDATHVVEVRAGLEDRNADDPLPPFDLAKLVSSPAFARLIGFDVHALDQLTHPS